MTTITELRQLENSIIPGSIPVTNTGNVMEFVVPGNTGEYLGIDPDTGLPKYSPIDMNNWKIQGNSGTNQYKDYIGTNDSAVFSVKQNGFFRQMWYGPSTLFGSNSTLQSILSILPTFISGIFSLDTFMNVMIHSNTTQSAGFRTIRRGGTIGAPTIPPANSILGFFNNQGYTGTTDTNLVSVETRLVGTPTPTSMPTSYDIKTTPNGSITPVSRFFINPNGVGIGTTTPVSNFQINGSIGSNATVITGTYIVLGTDNTIICNNAATAITITLPNPTTCLGREISISRAPGSSGVITITNAGTPSIQNDTAALATTYTLPTATSNKIWQIKFKAVTIGATTSRLQLI